MAESVVKHKSYAFASRIVKLSQFLQSEKKEFVLSKQVMRSGTSIGALVREAEKQFFTFHFSLKMRAIEVYHNGALAGTLTEENRQHFVFRYDDNYFNDPSKPAVSLTLPKTRKEYSSKFLFPFFYNMLSEGVNRKLQCTQLRIDEEDSFGLLGATAQYDTIGAVTVKPIATDELR